MQYEELSCGIFFMFDTAEPAFFRRAFVGAKGNEKLQEHFATLSEQEQKRLTKNFGGDRECRSVILSLSASKFLLACMQHLAETEQPAENQFNIPSDLAQQLGNIINRHEFQQITRHVDMPPDLGTSEADPPTQQV
ncbi:MAG TPA: hypothetical protein VHD60_00580 [Candidatus Saccharimonadales bacterium]|nr:hypothetical protein [Candidatus Saccharimonadales bacterium]